MTDFDGDPLDGEFPRGLIELLILRFPESRHHEHPARYVRENLTEAEAEEAREIARNFFQARSFRAVKEPQRTVPPSGSDHLELVERQLEDRGDVVWLGDGLALLKGQFLDVKLALEQIWRMRILARFQPVEIENPAIWSPQLAVKSGHLNDFPHESAFVFGAKPTGESRMAITSFFSEEATISVETAAVRLLDNLELIGLNQPSVCTSCYEIASATDWLGGAILTTQNRVFRNEGTRSLSRLMSFTVRDLIVIGPPSTVETESLRFQDTLIKFLEDLELPFSLEEATDPFFGRATGKLSFQAALGLKKEFRFGHAGGRNSFAFASANRHLDNFSQRFDWNGAAEKGIKHSACLGVGFERLTLALFTNFGPDRRSWPKSLQKDLALS